MARPFFRANGWQRFFVTGRALCGLGQPAREFLAIRMGGFCRGRIGKWTACWRTHTVCSWIKEDESGSARVIPLFFARRAPNGVDLPFLVTLPRTISTRWRRARTERSGQGRTARDYL